MFPNLEVRHLHAVIVLAEELNFTRAADRLHITQPALSKQITDLEAEHRFHLFTRDTRRVVELTDAGRAFVEEARSALFHTERAVHLAHAAHHGSDSVLTIGHSPFANHDWISAMLAIRLPLYPRLGIRLTTQFAMESVRSVLVGEVNLALVTAPPQHSQITAVPFAPAQLYAALPETHPAAHNERLVLKDLAKDKWILFPKRVHPLLYEAVTFTRMTEINLRPFLRPQLDILFVALNPPTQSNDHGHYFSGGGSRLFHLLFLSGLITMDLPKATADQTVFGSTSVNRNGCAFGVVDLVDDLVQTNSGKVRPTRQHLDRLIASIRELSPRFVCVIHSKVRDALNKHPDSVHQLDYGICGPLLSHSKSVFVLNYFPNGNSVPDKRKLKIFRALRDEL